MRYLGRTAALVALAGLAGCATQDEPRGGGGGAVYQAERRPDPVAARRHMAQVLLDAGRLNASLMRGDWDRAAPELQALRDGLRLAAARSTLDQQSRIIAIEGRAIEVASRMARRDPETVRHAGMLIRDVVAYHEIHAWGLASALEPVGGGGGPRVDQAPEIRFASPLPEHVPPPDYVIP